MVAGWVRNAVSGHKMFITAGSVLSGGKVWVQKRKPPPKWAAVCTWHVAFTKELRHIHCHSEEVVFRQVFVRDVCPVGIQ